jgi:glutamine amidotransferase
MKNLRRYGLDAALRAAVSDGKPVLAICIGMQLLFAASAESFSGAAVECLALLPGAVRKFSFAAPERATPRVKIPHMGWNAIQPGRPHPLLRHLPPDAEMYFAHSYYCVPQEAADVVALTEYGGHSFCSAAGRDNLIATQFHPEKSGSNGLAILREFSVWDGKI